MNSFPVPINGTDSLAISADTTRLLTVEEMHMFGTPIDFFAIQEDGVDELHRFQPGVSSELGLNPTSPRTSYGAPNWESSSEFEDVSENSEALQVQKDLSEMVVTVSDVIPPLYGGADLTKEHDKVLEPVLNEYKALVERFLDPQRPAGSAFYEDFVRLSNRFDQIWKEQCISSIRDLHILMYDVKMRLPWYTKCAQLTESYENEKKKTGASLQVGPSKKGQAAKKKLVPFDAFVVGSPVPHAPKKDVKTGEWLLGVALSPGLELGEHGITCTVKAVSGNYAPYKFGALDNSKPAAAKKKLITVPACTASPIVYDKTRNVWVIKEISFVATSGGRPFQVEFTLTAWCKGGLSYSATVLSMPFTTASNVNQWPHSNGCYVAFLAFGGANGPLSEVPYPAFFNAIHFSFLILTRQMISQDELAKLKQNHDIAQTGAKKTKVDPDSARSAQRKAIIDLYEANLNFANFKRFLTLKEVQAIFIPLIRKNEAHQDVEVMSFEAFVTVWREWWAEFAYSLFTGQVVGSEPRRLFLDGLIHLIPPTSEDSGILTTEHKPGTALIRPSAKPGWFTYNAVVTQNGKPVIVKHRIAAPGGEYVTDLMNQVVIKHLLNIDGVPIDKTVIQMKYMQRKGPLSIQPVDKKGYGPLENIVTKDVVSTDEDYSYYTSSSSPSSGPLSPYQSSAPF
jgi:hypothetical protein